MPERVLGVLAGDRVSIDWLRPWIEAADRVVAADGGADLVLEAGGTDYVVVGDMDSASLDAIDRAKSVIRVENQNFSDCDKLLAYCLESGYSELVLCGVEGDRVDHMLATLHSVARSGLTVQIAYRTCLARILVNGELTLKGSGTISVLPLENTIGVEISGVRWPLQRTPMSARGQASLSNSFDGMAKVQVERGVVAVFWSYDGLPTWDPVAQP